MDLFSKVFLVDFGIQILFGTLALLLNTEKFFDFIGSLTFIACTILSYLHVQESSIQEAKFLHGCCICLWAAKLGTFLLMRVMKAGEDKRFREIKKNKPRFFMVWIIQGIWVYLNMFPSLFVFQADHLNSDLVIFAYAGWLLFMFGLVFETVADYEKTVFRNDPANKDRFITTGLWSISRHPNYFGEYLLWFGLWIASVPFYTSPLALLSVFCPTLTLLQILFISGVPMLEKAAIEKWGKDPEFVKYMAETPCIVPFFGMGKEIVTKSE